MTCNHRPAVKGWDRVAWEAMDRFSRNDLAGITPAVRIGWSRGGDWGKQELIGESRPSATGAGAW
jgi:hypothetical protein